MILVVLEEWSELERKELFTLKLARRKLWERSNSRSEARLAKALSGSVLRRLELRLR